MRTIDITGVTGKRVMVRGDLDVTVKDEGVVNDTRLTHVVSMLRQLKENNPSKIVIVGHRGRPEGQNPELSLEPLVSYFSTELACPVSFVPFCAVHELTAHIAQASDQVVLVENLRFWSEEEANDEGFAHILRNAADVYVNEAFASSHREHASVSAAPKLFGQDAYAGIRFSEEVTHLSQVRENPQRPCIAIISGVKEDKLTYVGAFKSFCDRVLIGGRLPEYLGDTEPDAKTVVARLNPDKEDITIHSIELFEEEVGKAKTIIVSGPIGKYEDEGHRLGTQRVFRAVASSDAFKLAGGGDTEEALTSLGFAADFDWVSIGGGAMLEYLANGTLPGIEALLH